MPLIAPSRSRAAALAEICAAAAATGPGGRSHFHAQRARLVDERPTPSARAPDRLAFRPLAARADFNFEGQLRDDTQGAEALILARERAPVLQHRQRDRGAALQRVPAVAAGARCPQTVRVRRCLERCSLQVIRMAVACVSKLRVASRSMACFSASASRYRDLARCGARRRAQRRVVAETVKIGLGALGVDRLQLGFAAARFPRDRAARCIASTTPVSSL